MILELRIIVGEVIAGLVMASFYMRKQYRGTVRELRIVNSNLIL